MHTPNSHYHSSVDVYVDPCSFLAMSKAISEDSDSDSMVSRGCREVSRTAYRKDRLWWWCLDSGGRSNLMVGRIGFSDVQAFLILMVLQSPLLNTQFCNPPPSFGNAMTGYRFDNGDPTPLRR